MHLRADLALRWDNILTVAMLSATILAVVIANVAQSVEQLFRKQQVRGSSPRVGSIFPTPVIDQARSIAAQLAAARQPVEGNGISVRRKIQFQQH